MTDLTTKEIDALSEEELIEVANKQEREKVLRERIHIEKLRAKPPAKAAVLKKKSNYAKIKFGYSRTYVLPYEDGMALMASMRNAEKYDTSNYENHTIAPIDKDDSPEMEIISEKTYLDLKM